MWTVIVVAILALPPTVTSLKCHQSYEQCDKIMCSKELYPTIKDCSSVNVSLLHVPMIPMSPETNGTRCTKVNVVNLHNGESFAVRSCAPTLIDGCINARGWSIEGQKLVVDACFCDTDACNGANSFGIHIFVFASILIALKFWN